MLKAFIKARLPNTLTATVSAKITGGSASYETYRGAYTVDPDFDGITLETRGKVMRDDVTVKPIEVARVSNTQGGKTVYIGGIING